MSKFNLYKSTEYCSGRNWGGDRSTYSLIEKGDIVPESFNLVKTELTVEQIEFLKEIEVIASEEFRLKMQKFSRAIAEQANPTNTGSP
jgi:hypothetical protein